MTKRRVRIHTGAVFLWSALAFFVVRELIVWQWMRRIRMPLGMRVLVFLFKKGATPNSVRYALVFAFVATVLLEVSFRLIVQPLVRHWLAPWTDGSAGLFHLAANEWLVDSSPARRAAGLRWPAGTLVRTNHRLWFFPRAHDAEIWSCPLDALREIRLEPAPRVGWGFILGWPDRLALQAGDGQGSREVFAVPEPEAVLAWFHPAQSVEAPRPAGPSLSTPRRL